MRAVSFVVLVPLLVQLAAIAACGYDWTVEPVSKPGAGASDTPCDKLPCARGEYCFEDHSVTPVTAACKPWKCADLSCTCHQATTACVCTERMVDSLLVCK